MSWGRLHALNRNLISYGKVSTLLPIHLKLSLCPFVFVPLCICFSCFPHPSLLSAALLPISSCHCRFSLVRKKSTSLSASLLAHKCTVLETRCDQYEGWITQNIPLSSSRNKRCKATSSEKREPGQETEWLWVIKENGSLVLASDECTRRL